MKKLNQAQKIEYSFLKILTGSDLSQRKLPVMEAKSVNSGPVVWLTACVHGDELGGIVIIQEIFKLLKKKPLLKGTVYAFPLMNPIGFETASRHINISEEGFPGRQKRLPGRENRRKNIHINHKNKSHGCTGFAQ